MKTIYSESFKEQLSAADQFIYVSGRIMATFSKSTFCDNYADIISGDWVLNESLIQAATIFCDSITQERQYGHLTTIKENPAGDYTVSAAFCVQAIIDGSEIEFQEFTLSAAPSAVIKL